MSLTVTLSIVLFGVAAALMAYLILSALNDKDHFRQTMKRAQGAINQDEREENLNQSFFARVFKPTITSLIPFVRSKTPAGYIDKIRKRMIQLGRPDNDSVDTFVAARLLSVAIIIPVALFVFFTRIGGITSGGGGITSYFPFLIWLILVVVAIAGPDVYLSKKVEKRRTMIQDQLPDTLDLLTISVEAGLGFEQAVDRVVSNVPGPLSEEMNRMLGESRSGMSRAESLRALDKRIDLPDIRSFVMAILQADKFGVSIGRVLRMQSDEMRIKRRQIAQEKAQKAPVKMLVPTVLCIFPVLFIVVLAPAILRIMGSL